MAINDVFELRLTFHHNVNLAQGQNIFYYRDVVGMTSGRPTSLMGEFTTDVIPDIQQITNANTKFDKLFVRNLFDPTEVGESVLGLSGNLVNEVMPNFVAFSFRCARGRSDMRAGAKRFGYVDEPSVVNGIVSAGVTPGLTALAAQLGAYLQVGAVDTWQPWIVKRVREGFPGAYTYRLPQNAGESEGYEAFTWGFNTLVTSQTSRKAQ